jgi:small ligand-binding sensory domain FIST
MLAQSAIVRRDDWDRALEEALDSTATVASKAGHADLVFLFASHAYAPNFPAMVQRAQAATGATVLIGCSGQGIIGNAQEIEREPAVSVLTSSLPGMDMRPIRFTQSDLERCAKPDDWHDLTGVRPDDVNAWVLFADPFTLDAERLIGALSNAYPGKPLVGGLASGDFRSQQTHLFQGDRVYSEGAVAVALGGDYTIQTVVSQGADPIGETWTITAAEGNLVQEIGHKPALEVVAKTLNTLAPGDQTRARNNLLVGLAMDEYRDDFARGSFLIRNIVGIDPKSGALAIAARPRIGQTFQLHLRDERAADADLRALLGQAKLDLGDRRPVCALLCSCNGRGVGLFGYPDHDARMISEQLGIDQLAGFFCNGEIGPVGLQNHLHGYTACVALVVPKTPQSKSQ